MLFFTHKHFNEHFMKTLIIRLALLVIFFGSVIAWYVVPDQFFVTDGANANEIRVIELAQEVSEPQAQEVQEKENLEKVVVEESQKTIKDRVDHAVAFTVQAPHAQWDDPQYQDACEEASMVMAYAWIMGENSLSKNDAEAQIEKIFQKEKEMFDDAVDTSATDTALFFESYYKHDAVIKKDVTVQDLYVALSDGNIIIVPTNGKMLQNPNFTDGGPDRHMLVITGYDKENREFITNDPGTRLGRGYKYKDSTLYNAIRDYHTGNKLPIQTTQKNVVIIGK